MRHDRQFLPDKVAAADLARWMVGLAFCGAMIACSSPEEIAGIDGGSVASELGGVLTEDLHLLPGEGFHLVSADLLVPGGITMSAAPGTEIRVVAGASIVVHGVLELFGSATDSIRVGSASAFPDVGDWQGIAVDSTGALARCSFTRIRHADRGMSVEAGGRAELDSSTIAWSRSAGLWVGSGQAVARGCEFLDSVVGAHSDAGRLRVHGARFVRCHEVGFLSEGGVDTVSHSVFTETVGDGICLESSTDGLVLANRVEVGGIAIALRDGPRHAIVDSNDVRGGRIGLRAHGARESSAVGNSFLGVGRWAVECFATDINIESNFIDSCGAGIRVAAGAEPSIRANRIERQAADGIRIEDGHPAIHSNAIVGNRGFGIWTPSWVSPVDASDNWWGDPTGPQDEFGNPTGLGDIVTRWVDYVPWSDTPPGN